MNLKTPLYIILGMAIMYLVLKLTAPKPALTNTEELQAKIESLSQELDGLKQSQADIYSTDSTILVQLWQVDDNLTEVKKKTDLIGIKYTGAAAATTKYTPNQVDSFYRQRYKY
jgi:uncharacterized membrane-anchored protein YhcB (DUF1043 family)